MKVILQENIDSLGYMGDVLDVADGYARNFLLPRQKALEANPRNVKALEHAKRVTAHKAKKVEQDIQGLAAKLSKVSLTFPVQAARMISCSGPSPRRIWKPGCRPKDLRWTAEKFNWRIP